MQETKNVSTTPFYGKGLKKMITGKENAVSTRGGDTKQ
jgi:hypothetical protein